MIFRIATIVLFIGVFFILQPSHISAQGVWSVSRIHSEVIVNKDGQVEVIENIQVNYGENEVAGFTRSLPLKYTVNESVKFASVEIDSVQRNNVDEPFTVYSSNEVTEIAIGDSRLTLSGVQEYKIVYQVAGIIHHKGETDLLYWTTSGGWEHEVEQAKATLTLPKDGLKHNYCEIYNSRGQLLESACQSIGLNPKMSRYVSPDNIEAGGSMLIAAEFTHDLVPVSNVTPPTFIDWIEVYRQPLLWLSGVSTISLLLAGFLSLKARRVRKKSIEVSQSSKD